MELASGVEAMGLRYRGKEEFSVHSRTNFKQAHAIHKILLSDYQEERELNFFLV